MLKSKSIPKHVMFISMIVTFLKHCKKWLMGKQPMLQVTRDWSLQPYQSLFLKYTWNDEEFRKETDLWHHTGLSPLRDCWIWYGLRCAYRWNALGLFGGHEKIIKNYLDQRKDSSLYQSNERKEMSQPILKRASMLPKMKLNRRGRPLEELDRWKAVEFQIFVFYTGPVVLKKILSTEKYEHFLYWHVAIRVLCDPRFASSQIEYAGACLKHFPQEFGRIHETKISFTTSTPWFTFIVNACSMVLVILLALFLMKVFQAKKKPVAE